LDQIANRYLLDIRIVLVSPDEVLEELEGWEGEEGKEGRRGGFAFGVVSLRVKALSL
jgi:hypothetical protein